jgi:class 3 adenylate cyclase
MKCPRCQHEIPDDSKFCKDCGHALANSAYQEKNLAEVVCERKQVTILFSDMAGYTAMNERLDPEEVKGIMSRVFGQITQVIAKYDGFIERFVGDAVMAIFGIPQVHEDDPVRAIRAAIDIHKLVEALSPELEPKTGPSYSHAQRRQHRPGGDWRG